MNKWIAIVDMEQPDIRHVVVIEEDEFACATFESVDEIRELQRKHSLGVFTWWAFNFVTGEVEDIWR